METFNSCSQRKNKTSRVAKKLESVLDEKSTFVESDSVINVGFHRNSTRKIVLVYGKLFFFCNLGLRPFALGSVLTAFLGKNIFD